LTREGEYNFSMIAAGNCSQANLRHANAKHSDAKQDSNGKQFTA